MGIGVGLSSFADAYLKASQVKQGEDRNDLQFSLAGREIKGQDQEKQDLASLAQIAQKRRAASGAPDALAMGPGAPIASGGQMVGDAGDLAGAGVSSPGVAGMPAMPGVPTPRQPLLNELPPDLAGRIMSRPTSRATFKDLETSEREQEQAENRKKAEEVFKEANAAIKGGDALGFYDQMSKAMRLVGQHERAGQYLKHALSLRQDKDELEKSNTDLKGWLGAKSKYDSDPSPENYQGFLDALGTADSKSGRALRQQILGNVVAKTFNQNPQITSFNKAVAKGYQDAFQSGKQADAETIFKAAAAENPTGFNSYLFDAMANGKNLPEVVLKKVLRWDVADAKEIPKDVWSFAYARTQALMPGVRQDDPKFMERWHQEVVRIQKQMSEAKGAEKGDTAGKELRADLDGARKRLSDVRSALRQKDLATEDPERHQELTNEERQAKADLASLENKSRKSGTLGPEVKPEAPKAKAPSVRPKADDIKGVKLYKNAAKMEFERLRQAGLDDRAAVEAMKANGWDIGG